LSAFIEFGEVVGDQLLENVEQAKGLVEGSFHEMKDDIRLVEWRKMVALWEHATKASEIKKEIRL